MIVFIFRAQGRIGGPVYPRGGVYAQARRNKNLTKNPRPEQARVGQRFLITVDRRAAARIHIRRVPFSSASPTGPVRSCLFVRRSVFNMEHPCSKRERFCRVGQIDSQSGRTFTEFGKLRRPHSGSQSKVAI